MAFPRRLFRPSNVVVLGLALVMMSRVAEVAARGKIYSLEPRRGVVDVTSFGAKANDPLFDNAQAFIEAWNAACKGPGPAKLVIPPGSYITGAVVFQGPCTSSPVTVEVQGTILALPDPSVYTNGDWFTIEMVDGIVFKGGVFDAQGQNLWQYNDCKSNPDCQHLPVSIHLNKAQNVAIDGVTSLNSMGFHVAMTFSSNITATKLNLTAPGDSPNTDGIHISTTSSVNISDSFISTGDDCLGIIQGASDISVTGIQCGPGHGISIGSLGKYPNEQDVRGVHVKNCTLTGTTNGVRIKTFPGKLQLEASDIVFEDIVMNNVANPILIDQYYGFHQKLSASRVKVHDVHFRNIRGTSASLVAVSLACSSLFPCEGIELADIDLSYTGRKPLPISASCTNAKPTFSGKQNPPSCALI
ncbi:hypothetical protein CDL15_Pgr018667 [Punica granatum]|uniref:Exopolygalacturonase-like n=1 Tax=Punica granatum TaxID=22663 RepID=A0A218WZU4_PUNGR|nr:hypothetical protein CDL15_Pgr018667 [Punica granatum]